MNKLDYDVAFVLDQMPLPNRGGAAAYNYAILNASTRLGLKIFVLITGRRLPKVIFPVPDQFHPVTVDFSFLHAKAIGRKFFAVGSLDGLVQILKSGIKKLNSSKPAAPKIAKIERFPTVGEVKRAGRMLDRVSAPVIIVDTIFRDAFLADRPVREKRVLIAHDVFHERVASFEANGYRVTPRIDACEEQSRLSRYSVVLAISDHDASSLKQLAPNADVRTVFPVVKAISAVAPNFTSGRILYLGTTAHHNVDGLRWFLEDIWPSVLNARPEAVLDVVGSIGSMISPQPNVMLHGRVDDFRKIASNVAFAVNPVRMGSGLKVKMVDYFNLNLGCITTSTGARGFPPTDKPFAVHDDASAFASAAIEWLANTKICRTMSALANKYTRNFSTSAVEHVLRDLISR